jgi:neutral ceramidase
MPSEPDNLYEVGVAEADITPPVGAPLSGNFRDDYASRGVHTPIRSRSLVVRKDGSAVAIVAADLLTVSDELVGLVRRQVADRCPLQAGQIMVSAVHTHSGPPVEALTDGDSPAATLKAVLPGMVDSCLRAWEARAPGRLWAGRVATEGLCFNRRLPLKDGRTVMNWTRPPVDTIDRPLGPVDGEISFLLAGEDRDHPRFVAANLALHAAVLAGDNWLINADWPGFYYRAAKSIYGANTTAMFLQGAEGNVNHIDAFDPTQGRGFKEAQRIGDAAALATASAGPCAGPLSGPVRCSAQSLLLPPRRLTPEQVRQAEAIVAQCAGQAGPKGQVDGIPDLLFAQDQLELSRRAEPLPAQVQVLRIGEAAWVALPGEFFVEFGLEIKRRSPARVTFVVGLANGSVGYVPTEEAFAQGGYEPTPWRFSRLAPEAGGLCVESAIRQLRHLFQ